MARRYANFNSRKKVKARLQAALYYSRQRRRVVASGGELLLETGEFFALENGQHLLLE